MSSLKKREKRKFDPNPIEIAKNYLYKDPVDGLEIRFIDKKKGRGLFATKKFEQGDFICCYRGNLASKRSLKELEEKYEKEEAGSYVFEFDHMERKLCIDATLDDGSFGRIINDSKYFPNSSVKKIVDHNYNPHLAVFANCRILKDEEVTFFYGEDLPWHEEEKQLFEDLQKEIDLQFIRKPLNLNLKNTWKEDNLNKMIFKYLLADIGKPVPIVYKKLELFEDDVAKDSWLIPLESTKDEEKVFKFDEFKDLKGEKKYFGDFSPILFGTLDSPLYPLSNEETEEDEKKLQEEIICVESSQDFIDYHCRQNRTVDTVFSSDVKTESDSQLDSEEIFTFEVMKPKKAKRKRTYRKSMTTRKRRKNQSTGKKHLHQENEQMGYFGCSEDEESGDEDVRKKRRKSEKGNLQNEIPESTCTCDRSLDGSFKENDMESKLQSEDNASKFIDEKEYKNGNSEIEGNSAKSNIEIDNADSNIDENNESSNLNEGTDKSKIKDQNENEKSKVEDELEKSNIEIKDDNKKSSNKRKKKKKIQSKNKTNEQEEQVEPKRRKKKKKKSRVTDGSSKENDIEFKLQSKNKASKFVDEKEYKNGNSEIEENSAKSNNEIDNAESNIDEQTDKSKIKDQNENEKSKVEDELAKSNIEIKDDNKKSSNKRKKKKKIQSKNKTNEQEEHVEPKRRKKKKKKSRVMTTPRPNIDEVLVPKREELLKLMMEL